MKRPRDPATLDLFRDFVPAPVVERFPDEEVKSWNLAGRVSKAVAATLDACKKSRADVATAMSEILDEPVSKAMLDAYASQAKEHQITALRLVALIIVTGDVRALNTLLADADWIVVPAMYEHLIRRERAREARERLDREEQAADAAWRARR